MLGVGSRLAGKGALEWNEIVVTLSLFFHMLIGLEGTTHLGKTRLFLERPENPC